MATIAMAAATMTAAAIHEVMMCFRGCQTQVTAIG